MSVHVCVDRHTCTHIYTYDTIHTYVSRWPWPLRFCFSLCDSTNSEHPSILKGRAPLYSWSERAVLHCIILYVHVTVHTELL